MSEESPQNRIRRRARELGFQDCRIAPAEPAAHREAFFQWLDDGCHGDMKWLERNRERRSDPRQVLPGAQSVIVLATNYHQRVEGRGRGRIAQYAWGNDYHDLLEKRLRILHEELEGMGGEQRYYVDTGPVLERDFASEAGGRLDGKEHRSDPPAIGNLVLSFRDSNDVGSSRG